MYVRCVSGVIYVQVNPNLFKCLNDLINAVIEKAGKVQISKRVHETRGVVLEKVGTSTCGASFDLTSDLLGIRCYPNW